MPNDAALYLGLLGTAGIVLIAVGDGLKRAARKRDREQKHAQAPGGNPFDSLSVELKSLSVLVPGVPPLPARPFEYDGWFDDVWKRIEMRSEQRTIEEHTKTLHRYDDLYRQYLNIMKTTIEIGETTHDFKRLGEKVSWDDAELKLKRREIDIKLKELDVREAELDAQIKAINNPKQTKPPAKPENQHPADKKLEQISAAQREAERRKRKYPEEAALIDHETRKQIECIREA